MDISTGHLVLSYMENHLNNSFRLTEEWDALCRYEKELHSTTDAATMSCNVRKNRTTDIVPYDRVRFVLDKDVNVSDSDYINASVIIDHDPKRPMFIATQGPLPHTVADFWQMVWESESNVIVNLTSLEENGVTKCYQYWPEQGTDLYHIYEVILVSEHNLSSDYIIRSFFLRNTRSNESRTVTQYHFLTWPDRDLPPSPRSLLDFRWKVNQSYRGQSNPIIVHCSDGSDRTGTYCLTDMVLTRLHKGAKELDISATLEHLRDQRMHMVSTKEQFEFVLLCIAEDVNSKLKTFP